MKNICCHFVSGLMLWMLAWPSIADSRFVQVAHFEQWPGVSQLIAYRNRIWLVNSHPFKDTNVADIYSYHPGDAQVQYERSLFSQDVGNPVVYDGLLHWPYEDPRRSAGAGEYAVTDGTHWQWRSMQAGRAMHVHAMGICNEQLVAVTGSWTGQMLTLDDKKQWQVTYEYPSGSAPFSRLVNIEQFGGHCVLAASANGENAPKLFSINEAQPQSFRNWPNSDRVDAITVHDQQLFAFVDAGNRRVITTYDGSQTTSIPLPSEHRPRALHSSGSDLWLVSSSSAQATGARGQLWRYAGGEFEPVAELPDSPIALSGFEGYLYIGTYSQSGGRLWTFPLDKDTTRVSQALPVLSAPLKKSQKVEYNKKTVEALTAELTGLITDPASTDNYAGIIRNKLARHPQLLQPEFGAAITNLLSLPLDQSSVKMFTQVPVTRENLIRWYMLTSMAINGYGRVDPLWINRPYNGADHSSGKMFDPAIAAIVTAGWLKQGDRQTLAALMARLNRKDDPSWVTADVIGALTAITNERFAYDTDGWNRWWRLYR